jgi:hypothetical protein
LNVLLDWVGNGQGDQMSLRKNRPECSPTHFFVKISAWLLRLKKVAQKFVKFL